MAGRATLSVLDTLLFIGATAVALAVFRSIAPLSLVERTVLVATDDLSIRPRAAMAHPSDGFKGRFTTANHAPSRDLRALIYGASPFLACWSTAVGLRGLRPGAARPGTLVTPLLFLSAIPVLLRHPTIFSQTGVVPSSAPGGHTPHWWWLAWLEWPREAGLAVAAGWLVCRLVGRWEPADTRLERVGRALGAGWIAAAAGLIVADWLHAFGY